MQSHCQSPSPLLAGGKYKIRVNFTVVLHNGSKLAVYLEVSLAVKFKWKEKMKVPYQPRQRKVRSSRNGAILSQVLFWWVSLSVRSVFLKTLLSGHQKHIASSQSYCCCVIDSLQFLTQYMQASLFVKILKYNFLKPVSYPFIDHNDDVDIEFMRNRPYGHMMTSCYRWYLILSTA